MATCLRARGESYTKYKRILIQRRQQAAFVSFAY
jgi:hypothetical protein